MCTVVNLCTTHSDAEKSTQSLYQPELESVTHDLCVPCPEVIVRQLMIGLALEMP